jgi:hypothetical protein
VWTLAALPRLPSGGYLYAVDGASPDDVWAVGSIVAPKTVKALILHWDGSSWTVAQHPQSAPGSRLVGIDAPRHVSFVAWHLMPSVQDPVVGGRGSRETECPYRSLIMQLPTVLRRVPDFPVS